MDDVGIPRYDAVFWEVPLHALRSVLPFAGLLVACAPAPPEAGLSPSTRTTGAVRYDDVHVKSAHNAYQRSEALPDQLVYHRLRALELDIHVGKTLRPSVPGDWYVYHSTVDSGTSCDMLSDCLTELGRWHRDQPDHEVLTLVLDLKDDLQAGWTADDLDGMLLQAFGADLFTPADLLAACTGAADLRSAVTGACSWPLLDDLRGRALVQLTAGSSTLDGYASSDGAAAGRAAFVSWPAASAGDVAIAPGRAAFFNLSSSNLWVGADVAAAGLMSRVWGLNSSGLWSSAVSAGVHQLATDKVNFEVDGWARTDSATGFPFSCRSGAAGCALGAVEGDLDGLLVAVDSGDQWGGSDDFAFLYDTLPPGATGVRWQAGISTANSHIEDYGKGCLMARRARTAAASYLAVCRPADRHEVRVQVRRGAGNSTSAYNIDLTPAGLEMNESSVWQVRLEVSADRTCARGSASADGVRWRIIHTECFGGPLQYQGVSASSHSDGWHRYVFAHLTRSGVRLDVGDFGSFDVFGGADAAAYDGLHEVSPRLP